MWKCENCSKELPRFEDRESIDGRELCHSCYEEEMAKLLSLRRQQEKEQILKRKVEATGISSKEDYLLQLAKKRQKAHYPPYNNLCDYYDSDPNYHECDFVSPLSKSAHNVDAQIMLMLNDWDSQDHLKNKGHYEEFRRLGYEPLPEYIEFIERINTYFGEYGITFEKTYATNLFPFIKPGAPNANVPMKDMRRTAQEYGIPQIEIIQPKMLICLGQRACYTLLTELNIKVDNKMGYLIDNNPYRYNEKTTIFCQAHPSREGQSTRNRYNTNQVDEDWEKMKKWFEKNS